MEQERLEGMEKLIFHIKTNYEELNNSSYEIEDADNEIFYDFKVALDHILENFRTILDDNKVSPYGDEDIEYILLRLFTAETIGTRASTDEYMKLFLLLLRDIERIPGIDDEHQIVHDVATLYNDFITKAILINRTSLHRVKHGFDYYLREHAAALQNYATRIADISIEKVIMQSIATCLNQKADVIIHIIPIYRRLKDGLLHMHNDNSCAISIAEYLTDGLASLDEILQEILFLIEDFEATNYEELIAINTRARRRFNGIEDQDQQYEQYDQEQQDHEEQQDQQDQQDQQPEELSHTQYYQDLQLQDLKNPPGRYTRRIAHEFPFQQQQQQEQQTDEQFTIRARQAFIESSQNEWDWDDYLKKLDNEKTAEKSQCKDGLEYFSYNVQLYYYVYKMQQVCESELGFHTKLSKYKSIFERDEFKRNYVMKLHIVHLKVANRESFSPEQNEFYFRCILSLDFTANVKFNATDSSVIDLGGLSNTIFTGAGLHITSLLKRHELAFSASIMGQTEPRLLTNNEGAQIAYVLRQAMFNNRFLGIGLEFANGELVKTKYQIPLQLLYLIRTGPTKPREFSLELLMFLCKFYKSPEWNGNGDLINVASYLNLARTSGSLNVEAIAFMEEVFEGKSYKPKSLLSPDKTTVIAEEKKYEWLKRYLYHVLFSPYESFIKGFLRPMDWNELIQRKIKNLPIMTFKNIFHASSTLETMKKHFKALKKINDNTGRLFERYFTEHPDKIDDFIYFATGALDGNVPIYFIIKERPSQVAAQENQFVQMPERTGVNFTASTCFNEVNIIIYKKVNDESYRLFEERMNVSLLTREFGLL